MTLLSAIKSFSQLSIHGDLVKASVFPMLVNAPTLTVSRVTPSLPALSDSKGCGKCARTKKSGKNSCCARGGAWFKNCGDAGDTQFDHTWAEGIQACKDVVGASSVELPLQAILHHAGIIDHTTNTAQPEHGAKRLTYMYPPDSVSDAGTWSVDRVRLAKVVVCICVLFICSNSQI